MAKFLLKMRHKDREEYDRDRRVKENIRRKLAARFASDPDEERRAYSR